MDIHRHDCRCDSCCNRRIGRAPDAYRSAASRSVVHDNPTHLIRAWSGAPADEAPRCGAPADGANFMRRTEDRNAFDCAGNPMSLCGACLVLA